MPKRRLKSAKKKNSGSGRKRNVLKKPGQNWRQRKNTSGKLLVWIFPWIGTMLLTRIQEPKMFILTVYPML